MELDLKRIIEQVGKDKGISREIVVETLEKALVTAARRKYGLEREIEARFNEQTGEIELFEFRTVVENPVGDEQTAAHAWTAAGPQVRQHPARIDDALDEHLHLAAGHLAGSQARLDHPGIVHHQQITGFEKLNKLVEAAILKAAAVLHHQQTAAPAALGRVLGDELGRQFEMKITGAHGPRC